MAGAAIFISYRRGDAAGSARALYLVLRNWFGPQQVYFDQASIQPGDAFPAELRAAIEGARVVLCVIGPSWLAELNRRHRERPQETDVVREELKQALSLQAQMPGERCVVPLLMECETMPALADLDPAVCADLAPLWQRDARALGGRQQRWDHDVHGLLQHLSHVLQLPPLATAGDATRIASARAAVREHLELPSLEPLRRRWGDDPLSAFRMDDLEDTVVACAQAIDGARPEWRNRKLDNSTLLEVRQACREVLAALYGLAIDGASARMWLEEPDSRRPVPVASVGALGFAYAIVQGKKAQISDSLADRAGFEPEDAMDLGAPDPGGTSRRRAMVHRRLWQGIYADPRVEYPRGEQPLSGDDLDTLRRRLAARSRIQARAYLITEVQETADFESDLQLIAGELGIVALPRTGQDRGLLRVNELGFNALIAEALGTIHRIQ